MRDVICTNHIILIQFDIIARMTFYVDIVGAGLAGSEAALQLANRGVQVRLYEMRPVVSTAVHKTGQCCELVCSNSLKSTNPASAAGMLKHELSQLNSQVYACALKHQVAAGGALAVDRDAFSSSVHKSIVAHPNIELIHEEVCAIPQGGDAVILASGPLTSHALAQSLAQATGCEHMAFYDAAAPIVMADSLNHDVLFSQSRYCDGVGDYLNAPFNKEEYEAFITELIHAQKVVLKDFERRELFSACQPIEEIARTGLDAPRFGPLKPVGLTDPATGKRPWAALQLRTEDAHAQSYNLVGFQTNLTFAEQRRVFRMIPGLENAEFARYGVMHRNTFINAPRLLDAKLRLSCASFEASQMYVAGQLAGTEGYCEAIRSGLHAALAVYAALSGASLPPLPEHTAFGALQVYATNPETADYQPMHANFGIMEPFPYKIRNKRERYAAYAERGAQALADYIAALREAGLMPSNVDGFHLGNGDEHLLNNEDELESSNRAHPIQSSEADEVPSV